MAKDILCAFGVDVDAVAGWLGSYGGAKIPRTTFPAACSPVKSVRHACSNCSSATACAPPGLSPATRWKPFPSR
ncbi:hypothetical protein QF039_000187 [Pseudomonas sp. W2I6]|nr:hypothetical protein [Pseudomonas sp. W2I6]